MKFSLDKLIYSTKTLPHTHIGLTNKYKNERSPWFYGTFFHYDEKTQNIMYF